MKDQIENENHDIVDAFTSEVMKMGRLYQETAMRLAAMRMHEVVFKPPEPPISSTKKAFQLSQEDESDEAVQEMMDRKSSHASVGEKVTVIDLDPVTNKPIRISDMDASELERGVDHEQA